jgi:hypothetical protein
VGLNLEAQVQCHPSNTAYGTCYGSSGSITYPVTQWIASGSTSRTLSFSSPDSSARVGVDADLIGYAFTQSALTATIPGAPDASLSSNASGFRGLLTLDAVRAASSTGGSRSFSAEAVTRMAHPRRDPGTSG